MCFHDWLVVERGDVSNVWRRKIWEKRDNYICVVGLFSLLALSISAIVYLAGEPSFCKTEAPCPMVISAFFKTVVGAVAVFFGMVPVVAILGAIEGKDWGSSIMTPSAFVEDKICRKCRKPVFGIEKHQKRMAAEAAVEAQEVAAVKTALELDAQLKADFENYKRLRKLMT